MINPARLLYFMLLTWTALAHSQSGPAVDHLTRRVVDSHRQARAYAQWRNSSYNPENLLRWLSRLTVTEHTALCRQLRLLRPDQLSLFYEWWSRPETKPVLPCSGFLARYYSNYLRAQVDEIRQISVGNPPPRPRLGPTEEIAIDASTGPVYFTADLPKGKLAFTFDDGPHPTLTTQLLTILRDQDIKAEFFLVGQNVLAYPDIVRETAKDGHSIGAHSMTHAELPKLSFQKARSEIFDSLNTVMKTLDWVDPFFRFPYGSRTKALQQLVKNGGIATFFWNIDTLDWKIRNPQELYSYILEQISLIGSGIVLFHDIQPQTIAILPEVFTALISQSYKPVVFRSPPMKPAPWAQ